MPSTVPPPISRVTRSKEAARTSYDRMSRWYDWIASSERKFARLGLELLQAKPGEKVLEIGYGTGHALAALANAVSPKGKVTGIDLSSGMRRKAETLLAKLQVGSFVELHLGDALKLPFPDGSFNAVFTCFTLELFDTLEIPIVLGECRRVLQDDGRICVCSLAKEESPAVHIYELFHRLIPAWIDCRPIYLLYEMRSAGYKIQSSESRKMWGLPVQIVIGCK